MQLRLEQYRDNWHHGRLPDGCLLGAGPVLAVESEDDGGGVELLIDPAEKGETDQDRPISRTLSPAEARELAAMLRHHADEQERRFWR